MKEACSKWTCLKKGKLLLYCYVSDNMEGRLKVLAAVFWSPNNTKNGVALDQCCGKQRWYIFQPNVYRTFQIFDDQSSVQYHMSRARLIWKLVGGRCSFSTIYPQQICLQVYAGKEPEEAYLQYFSNSSSEVTYITNFWFWNKSFENLLD